jgi:hypothetical protein
VGRGYAEQIQSARPSFALPVAVLGVGLIGWLVAGRVLGVAALAG